MAVNELVVKRLKNIRELYPLPTVALEVIRLLSDENVDARRLGPLIESDAALTAKFLRAANSPYYGARMKILTAQHAIAYLGMRESGEIAMSAALHSRMFEASSEGLALMKRLWNHSFIVGKLTVALNQYLRLGLTGKDFVAGVLHDIGKHVVIAFISEVLPDIERLVVGEGMEEIEAEKIILGTTHPMIGSNVAKMWNLPSMFIDVIEHHHDPEQAAVSPELCATVRIVNIIMHENNRGVFEGGFIPSLAIDPALRVLQEAKKGMTIDPQAISQFLSQELAKADEYRSNIGLG